MKKCLLWGIGDTFARNINIVRYHEMTGHFRVIGITSREKNGFYFGGYDYLDVDALDTRAFDCVIVMTSDRSFREICSAAQDRGIPRERMISYRALFREDFDVDKYLRLNRNVPSIFSVNCWGALTYHSLGLEFLSPTINLWMTSNDFLRLMQTPEQYLREPLKYSGMCNNAATKLDYPIATLGDVTLHMSHYASFESAVTQWEKRKQRVRWDNLFVMMFTDRPDTAKRFAELPHRKKVCFVPFPSFDKSLMTMDFSNSSWGAGVPMWKLVNGMASGRYPYYDVYELLGDAGPNGSGSLETEN